MSVPDLTIMGLVNVLDKADSAKTQSQLLEDGKVDTMLLSKSVKLLRSSVALMWRKIRFCQRVWLIFPSERLFNRV